MKVLYATNGLEVAGKAGTLIRRLGNRSSIDLVVLCVENIEFLLPAEPFVPGTEPKSRKQPEEVLQGAEDEFREAGFQVETRMETGAPAHEILKIIERENVELTVVGAGTQSWLGNLLLGSTATSLLHSSPTSVLIVRDVSTEKRDPRILVGVDGSGYADQAVEVFSRFADPGRCSVTVLSVAEPTKSGPHRFRRRDGDPGGLIEEELQEVSASTAHKLSDQGFTAISHVVIGSPLRELLSYADEGDFDLVVVGSRGLGSIKGAILGSVSDQVTRHSRAVLVGHKQG